MFRWREAHRAYKYVCGIFRRTKTKQKLCNSATWSVSRCFAWLASAPMSWNFDFSFEGWWGWVGWMRAIGRNCFMRQFHSCQTVLLIWEPSTKKLKTRRYLGILYCGCKDRSFFCRAVCGETSAYTWNKASHRLEVVGHCAKFGLASEERFMHHAAAATAKAGHDSWLRVGKHQMPALMATVSYWAACVTRPFFFFHFSPGSTVSFGFLVSWQVCKLWSFRSVNWRQETLLSNFYPKLAKIAKIRAFGQLWQIASLLRCPSFVCWH